MAAANRFKMTLRVAELMASDGSACQRAAGLQRETVCGRVGVKVGTREARCFSISGRHFSTGAVTSTPL